MTPTVGNAAGLTAALVRLARHNIPADVQDLLISGDAMRGIPPGALAAALEDTASPTPDSYWHSIDTAPEDQHVILATTGGFVGEAIMLLDEDTGKQKWAWALGPVHPNHVPLGWRHLPSALTHPIPRDDRPGGFDGPTGAD